MRARLFALASLGLTLVAGCTEPTGARALWVSPAGHELAGEAWLDHPFPSDLRRDANGSPIWQGFYNPTAVPLLESYTDLIGGVLDGFSPVGAGELRFEAPIDPSGLPATPKEALSERSTVQLIDVTNGSPERGQRKLVSLQYREKDGVFVMENSLSFMPTLGFPLRPATTYALVVTTSLQDQAGESVRPSADLRKVLGLDPGDAASDAARGVLRPSLDTLAELGVEASEIAHLAVFTTADPTAELFAVRDAMMADFEAPQLLDVELRDENNTFVEFTGHYGPSPNYQVGNLPFQNVGDGGGFVFTGGTPDLGSTFDLRFSLTVPREDDCPMPPNGYPIALYAHGTGGSYRSYVADGTARALALECVAAMGIDGLYHGERPGAPDTETALYLLFFNFQNPIAGRTGVRQEALDHLQRARLFTETMATIPADVSPWGTEIAFDPSKVTFFGHSQGGLTMPLALAADDQIKGAVLSGSSSMMIVTLLEKTEPAPSIPDLVAFTLLGLNESEAQELDLHHPVLTLVQSFIDVSDPIHYARYMFLEPRFAPKSIYLSEGINPDGTGDHYSPPRGTEAEAIAMGLPLLMPAQRPPLELLWGGPAPIELGAGISGNLANGQATGALVQWAPFDGEGHFVIFDIDPARDQAARFIRSVSDAFPGSITP